MPKAKKDRTYKELNKRDQDMVLALAMGLSASKGADDENKLAYTAEDVARKFRLSRRSLAAVQANVTRSN